MKEDVKKKTCMNSNCSKGIHTYICAAWKVSPTKKVCDLFVCQHCMIPFTKQEREIACQTHRESNASSPNE